MTQQGLRTGAAMIEATPTAATAAAKLRDVPEPELSYVANATRFPTFRCQKLGDRKSVV